MLNATAAITIFDKREFSTVEPFKEEIRLTNAELYAE